MSARVVRNHFEILEDTYLGCRVSPWTRARSRRLIQTEKFYVFDVGVANVLARRQLRALGEEGRLRRAVVVCLERERRTVAPGIEILPWRSFLGELWSGGLGV